MIHLGLGTIELWTSSLLLAFPTRVRSCSYSDSHNLKPSFFSTSKAQATNRLPKCIATYSKYMDIGSGQSTFRAGVSRSGNVEDLRLNTSLLSSR
ncbi:hypothetical protein BKA65DRAFT_489284 [Rhexocercosporidium sp. MPI-PUGE-AT-0058]|nr:hypothetical protein BKA65DRAFT_489284 [Rhexocercosporidium sp. MPI-PUGE-AT-0058]